MAEPHPFRKVKKRLESNGWHLSRIRGSHHVFKHERLPTVSIPVHRNQVKAFYVEEIEKIIREAEAAEDQG
jgi:predicted RNA binding protein YcfA (HicA-like mRNA interferase family)